MQSSNAIVLNESVLSMYLTVSILNFYLPLTSRPMKRRTLSQRPIIFTSFIRFKLFDSTKELENYPIPIVLVCELRDITRPGPSPCQISLTSVARSEVFRINWVMYSWQILENPNLLK